MKVQTIIKALSLAAILAAIPLTAVAADSMSAGDSSATRPYIAPGADSSLNRAAINQNDRTLGTDTRTTGGAYNAAGVTESSHNRGDRMPNIANGASGMQDSAVNTNRR